MFRGKPPDTYPLSKDEFIEHFKLQKLDKIDSFLGAKHMMIGLMGIKSSGTKGSL